MIDAGGPDAVGARTPGRRFRVVLWLLWIGALWMVALTPDWAREDVGSAVGLCILCGSKGLADAILNVVMFLPLGILVGVRSGLRNAILAGFLLSTGIETAQLYLPGRYPGLGDIVWNGVGATLGGVAVSLLRRWLVGPPSRPARLLAVVLPAIYLLGAGALMRPAGTDARYFGQWTADMGHLTPYEGELVEASLNGETIPYGPWPPGASPRRLLEAEGWRIEAQVVKGPPPEGVSPIVSVFDARQEEILLLGAHGEDLFWRSRTLASAIGLDMHDLRLPGALGRWAEGDTLSIAARREGRTMCLRAGEREACGLGIRPGRTWGLLMNLEGASPPFRALLDLGWMATLFFLVGLLGGSARGTAAAGGASVAVVIAAAALTPLVAPTLLHWAGLLLGVLGGVVARPAALRLVGVHPGSPPDVGESSFSG